MDFILSDFIELYSSVETSLVLLSYSPGSNPIYCGMLLVEKSEYSLKLPQFLIQLRVTKLFVMLPYTGLSLAVSVKSLYRVHDESAEKRAWGNHEVPIRFPNYLPKYPKMTKSSSISNSFPCTPAFR